jgi:hypothetical protein
MVISKKDSKLIPFVDYYWVTDPQKLPHRENIVKCHGRRDQIDQSGLWVIKRLTAITTIAPWFPYV